MVCSPTLPLLKVVGAVGQPCKVVVVFSCNCLCLDIYKPPIVLLKVIGKHDCDVPDVLQTSLTCLWFAALGIGYSLAP